MAFQPTGPEWSCVTNRSGLQQNKCAADSGCGGTVRATRCTCCWAFICSTTTKDRWHDAVASVTQAHSQQPITHYSAVFGVKPRDPYGVRSAGVLNKGHGARVPSLLDSEPERPSGAAC